MKNSIKAVILSGLAFPGLGQIVLKYYVRGIALVLATLAGSVTFIVKAVQLALSIIEKIASKGGTIDLTAITDAANQAVRNSDNQILKYSLLLVILCWVIGIIDAFIVGRKKDSEKKE